MRVLTVAATKGGVGKTTMTLGMGVEAAGEGEKIVFIDLDPQQSLKDWYDRRADTQNMVLLKNVIDVQAAIKLLAGEGADWVLIDTPPSQIHVIEPAIAVADFVLVPTKPGALDLAAIDPVVELCHQYRKKFAFIINGAPSAKSPLVKGAARYLSDDGTVLPTQIMNRVSYMEAPLNGKAAAEIDARGKSKGEMVALWAAVKRLSERMAV